jgi:hypothetical protein
MTIVLFIATRFYNILRNCKKGNFKENSILFKSKKAVSCAAPAKNLYLERNLMLLFNPFNKRNPVSDNASDNLFPDSQNFNGAFTGFKIKKGGKYSRPFLFD